MYFRSVMSREWKATAKTVVGMLSLLSLLFVLSMPVEGVTVLQRAVVRASDGHVYEIEYTKDMRVENFSIRGLDGTIPSREVAAGLYIAARLLNLLPINRPVDLESYVEEVYTNTAKWKTIHEIAKVIGTAPYEVLLAKLTGGTSAAAAIGDVAALIGGISHEAAVLLKARTVGVTFARRAKHAEQVFDEHRLLVDQGNETSIDNIKLAYLSFWKEFEYSELTRGIVNDHLFLPDRADRIANFFISLVPYVGTFAFFGSAVLDQVQLSWLEEMLESAEEDLNSKASAKVDEVFNEAAITNTISLLAREGFYDRKPPTIAELIEDMQLMVGDGLRLLDVTTLFSDLNGDRLEHAVEVTDSTIADVELILFRPDGELVFKPFLEITPKRVGATSVTIEATDPTRLSATQTFTITVDPTPAPNQPPEPIGTIPPQNLMIDSISPPLDVSVYFHDPDGGTIFYMAESRDRAVATTQHTGSQLTIWPRGIGTARITVTAANSDGLSATQTFTVTVSATEPPPERPISQGLRVGDSIIVQNTGGIGLNVRSDPWVSNQNPDNRIGRVYDGATGTIKNGTEPDANGHTWWEVAWDTSNKVQWQHQPANNRGWSVEAIGELELLARRPPEPVTQSFDLAIESFTVSKRTLDPGESFTLSITIRNDGPGDSPGPALSYYHSSIQGFSRTDPPQLQGTVELDPLASGERITKSIQLTAPATADTYYYGAWLAANTGDTDIYNDVATEIGVTVIDDPIDDPVETSDPPDLVIETISVDYDTMYPGERFTVSATVRNAGGRRASNVRLRYYRSSDRTYSTDDEEIANTDDFIGGLDGGETEDENAHLDAPNEPGVYYYIARVNRVGHERDTANNYDSIKITVLPPAAPDLVVSLTVEPSRRIVSLSANEYLIDPKKYFRLDATVDNQGKGESEKTEIHFYRSLDPYPSPEDDTKIETEEIKALRRADSRFYSSDEEASNGPAPTEPGTYYYYACVDSVPDERNTDNNCSNVVTINVRGPDLVVHSVSVDYFSRTHTTVRPDGIFELEVTVRNQGTEDADDSTLRYYISSDAILSSDDTEVATDLVYSLDMNEISKTYKSDWIDVLYTSGFFYALVCVDSVEDESDTTNNCYAPIKLTVRNVAPRAEGTIPAQTLNVGTSMSVDISDYFTDTNNDNLTYTAGSSDINAATVSVSGARVTIIPKSIGSATITVTASDGEFTATQTVSVVVEIETKVPDLLVDSVSVNKNTVAPGERFRLDAVIKNQGEADASAITVRYYQSTDETISTTDTERNTGTVVLIAVDGMKEPWAQLTAPDTPGVYYYGICVDGVEGESDTDNNCSEPVKITVQPPSLPDLVVESISVSDDTLDPDESFTLSVTVRNRGTAKSQSTILRYYAEFGEIGKRNVRRLSPNQAQEVSITLEASDETGTYYYDACVSKVRDESNTDNNCSTRIAITVGTPANRVPVTVGTIPDRTLTQGGSSERVDVSGNFRDPDGDSLTYKASSDDAGVVSVSVSGAEITLTPKIAGHAVVTVTASDGELTATQTISVSVTAGPVTPPVADQPVANRSPVSVGTISHRTLTVGTSEQVDVKGYFQDPDADTLTYKASSDNINVVSVDVSGSDVTLTPKSVGRASVTVTASDGKLIATQTISVSVLNSLNKITGPWLWIIAPTEVGRGGANSIDVDSLNAASGGAVTEASVAANGAKAGGTVGNYVWTLGEIAGAGRNNINDVINKIGLVDGRNPATTADDMNVDDHSSYALITLQSTTARSNVTMRAGSDDAIKVWLNGQVVHKKRVNRGAADFQDSFKVNLRKGDNLLLVKVSERSGRWSMFIGIETDVNAVYKPAASPVTSKITGPWLWIIAPTEVNQGGANSIDVDSLNTASGGAVTEASVAVNGAKAGGTVGNYVWTLGKIAETGRNNINDVINRIGLVDGRNPATTADDMNVDDHSSYALIILQSTTARSNATMRAGSDDAIKIWLNGQVVHKNPVNRPAADFQDSFKVNLRKGDNLLLVKVSERSGRWSMFVGIDADVNTETNRLTHARIAAPSLSASEVILPTETVLLPNYPNPFNPETWIPYQLSKPTDVTLAIYNVRGIVVRRLTLGHQPAGVYHSRARAAYWDGRNAFGERVASGLYFYTLTAGNFSATGKMLVRK